MSLTRVLDRRDIATDVGINLRILKGEIGIGSHLAVDESEIIRIAKGLSLNNLAIDKGQTVGIPSKIFAIEGGVDDSDVLRVPKGVLGVEGRVADGDVFAILERVVAVEGKVVNLNILAMHEDIIALVNLHIREFDVLAVPKGLGGMKELDIAQLNAVHVPEHLRRLDNCISHQQVARIPESGTTTLREEAVINFETVAAPEGVLALEAASVRLNVARLLEATLALVDGNILKSEVGSAVKWALALELFIFD